MWSISPGLTL
ncbi:unnamed protein product [Acanthoscelides obtectus]|uniref:Uncharacterized protein n=1 Tax=Acanthoscelides obtectus TaxID=200917 RepID=A0A9P0KQX8_ACAOB|nr:unnamed protein product [Acanthoscelides obtectus]CAK1631373.1 hypothetical protein AOBTE_LOCUS6913 [Acanthoscelides obtectus]